MSVLALALFGYDKIADDWMIQESRVEAVTLLFACLGGTMLLNEPTGQVMIFAELRDRR